VNIIYALDFKIILICPTDYNWCSW